MSWARPGSAVLTRHAHAVVGTGELLREPGAFGAAWLHLPEGGYDRYLTDTGAEPLHRDETGVLWRIQLPDDEPVVMVEVVNSTPEPDGTSRTYWLRVPPRIRTARAGVAWTFGVPEEEYQPLRET
jgi:hypothetical protein